VKFSKLILVLFFLLLSISVFPQTTVNSGKQGEDDLEINKKRIEQIKADILKEIDTFGREDQAKFYAWLGNIIWEHDKKEGTFWLSKGVEIGLSPAINFKNDSVKLTSYWNLLSNVLEKDVDLENKIISKIKEIKIDESNVDVLKRANETYIHIAEQIFHRKKDEKLAFEFAMLSLKGEKPAINWTSQEFFRPLKVKNETMANAYFAKLLEVVKTSGSKVLTANFVSNFIRGGVSNYRGSQFNISDAQKKAALEILIPFIQADAEALTLKKANNCGSISWGLTFSEDYKKLLPEKSVIVEQAIEACQNAEIEPWKKPDFGKRPRKSSQDFLNLAKEIGDKEVQANYLFMAALNARNEKDYQLAINILESIDQKFRRNSWYWERIYSSSYLIEELFKTDKFAEISNVLEGSPQEMRPFIIGRSIYSMWQLKPNQKVFVLDLLSQARSEFNKMDKSPVTFGDMEANPTKFANLTLIYVKFELYEEAITTHEESITALNRYVDNLPSEYKENKIFPIVGSYSRFTNRYPPNDIVFINKYFDRIYQNLGKIENSRIRLTQRFSFLSKIMEKPPQNIYIQIPAK